MTKEEYLNTLKDQIRDNHAKEFVCEEYKTHIEDQIDAYVNDGMNNEQATIAAVKDMGDPVNDFSRKQVCITTKPGRLAQ